MLNNSYSDFLSTIFLTGLQSVWGWAGLILAIAFLITVFFPVGPSGKLRVPVCWILAVAALVCLTTAFYSAIYEFDEDPESLVAEFALDTTQVCGSGTTVWTKAGYGFGNPCPTDCRKRGLTIRKEMRMTGFPPWPEYRLTLQCSRR